MFNCLRKRLPQSVKRPIRNAINGVDSAMRIYTLKSCIQKLRSLENIQTVDLKLLQKIRKSWGNEFWSPDLQFISEVASRIIQGDGPFLDCGSGLTTVVSAALAEQRKGWVLSLEQEESWYERMKQMLFELKLENVDLWFAPLRRYGDFVWYDLQGRSLPSEFTAVFCDGPAVFESAWPEPFYSSWRVGVVHILRQLQINFNEILLDDAEDQRFPLLRQRWEAAGLKTKLVRTSTGPFLVARSRH